MPWLISGITEALVALLCKVVSSLMGWFAGIFTSALGADPTAFQKIFPITTTLHTSFVIIAYVLCIFFFILGLFRNLGSGLGFAGENPFKMIARFGVACALIPCIASIMSWLYSGFAGNQGLFAAIYEGMGSELNSATGNTSGLLGSNYFDVIGSGTWLTTGGVSKIAVGILLLILIFTIAINFVKLLLEMFERYLMVNVLIFFSPLAPSAITLESTMKIFSSYMKMFFGQLLMLFFNLLSLYIIKSGMGAAAGAIGGSTDIVITGISNEFVPFVALLLVIAMMKILQRMDNYVRDLGLTVGITGGNLTDEIIGTAAAFKPMVGALTGGALFGKGKGGKSGTGAAASDGGLVGKMLGSSPLGMGVGALKDLSHGFKFAKSQTGLSNAGLVDMYKHYKDNGGFKGLMSDVGRGYTESSLARNGASVRGNSDIASLATNIANGAPVVESKAAENVRRMMNMSTPIKYSSSVSRGTQAGFREFATHLSPSGADGEAPIVPVSDMKNVSVGNAGALGTNSNGDLISFTAYEPNMSNEEFTSKYSTQDGQVYYAQNLTRANEAYMAEHEGKEYSLYSAAQRAIETGNTDYNFESHEYQLDADIPVAGSTSGDGRNVEVNLSDKNLTNKNS